MARLISELAQFNSELFQVSYVKNVDGKYDLDNKILPITYEYHGHGINFIDMMIFIEWAIFIENALIQLIFYDDDRRYG